MPFASARRAAVLALACGSAAGLAVATAVPASAGTVSQSHVVSANPIDGTPNIQNGTVWDVAKVSGGYVVAGTFTSVKNAGSDTTIARKYILKFDSAGKVVTSFAPSVNSTVYALWPSSDGQSVYVGGAFTQVNGASAPHIARLSASTGARVSGFAPPSVNGEVRDLTVAQGALIAGGPFSTVGGKARRAIASFSPTTGAATALMNGVTIAGVHYAPYGGRTELFDMEANSAGKLVFVGNFATVNGQPRNQVAMLNISGSSASLVNWRAPVYEAPCGQSFDAPIRDVTFSPGGTYLDIVATGGKHGGSACDAAARFSATATGNVSPTWTNFTGGDTLSAVEDSGAAVYVGGHQRWLSNPQGNDSPGPGAVPREGVGALNPADGKVLPWNPGHKRGVGVRVLRAYSDSLWLGADTNTTGGEYHGKIAGFPLG